MKRYLILQDGSVFEGEAFGADLSAIGELVFNTNVVGYMETLTDPSCFGQIVLQTFPIMGNYGIIPEDAEGISYIKGYVVREKCDQPSNFRSEGTLDAYLKQQGIPGIYGVDTRQITRIIRDKGTMNAIITDDPEVDLSAVKGYGINNAISEVSCEIAETFPAEGEERHNIGILDYGAKKSLIGKLCSKGCRVTLLPGDTYASDILSGGYDGLILSEGPGDPRENTGYVEKISAIMGKLPIMGIGMGHQLLAMANGADIEKMTCGHRGSNQPVKDTRGIRTYITAQNHGYTVLKDSVKTGVISYINANDGSVEGIDYPDKMAFSLQFAPADEHFDRLIALMEVNRNAS